MTLATVTRLPGYDESMKTKIAVSVPEELVEDAKRAVAAGSVRSVSAYVAAAMRAYRQKEALGDLLDDLAAEHGPLTDDDRRWARQQFGLSS